MCIQRSCHDIRIHFNADKMKKMSVCRYSTQPKIEKSNLAYTACFHNGKKAIEK